MKTRFINGTLMAVLSFMLVMILLPMRVFAADIATVKINGQLLQDGVPVQCGEGTAVLDEQSKTLTLKNATINQETNSSVIDVRAGDLKIILIGENKILSNEQRPLYGQKANITIQGTSADTLTVESNVDGIQVDQSTLTIDGCIVNVTSNNWGGLMSWGGTLTIQNHANITINSYDIALAGDTGISITDSTVNVTSNGAGTNAITSYGTISIGNSSVTATGTSGDAYPAIYAEGNISVANASNVTAVTKGMRGIFTNGDMTVNDSTVTAKGTTQEGMVVVGALTVNNSNLIASSKPNDYIPAIVTEQFYVTASEVTANGGFDLFNWNEGNTDNISFRITPASGKLAEFKVDGNNWDGSSAVHFKEGTESPYDTAVDFSADEMNWFGAYRYIHIGEHIHTGGTANCKIPATCEDCGRSYGNINPSCHYHVTKVDLKAATCTETGNREYWYCEGCDKYFSDMALTSEITEEQTVIPALGHNAVKTEEKAATCTETGNREYWYCEGCDKYFSDMALTSEITEEQTVIPALGHNAVKTEEKAATCTETGNREYWYCENCGKYFSDEALTKEITKDGIVVKATGHDIELKNVKEATCTVSGYTGDKICKVCGDVIEKGEVIAKTAHNYKDGKCIVCGGADPNYNPKPGNGDTTSPGTGDSSNRALWISLLFVSGVGLFGTAIYYRKRKYHQ